MFDRVQIGDTINLCESDGSGKVFSPIEGNQFLPYKIVKILDRKWGTNCVNYSLPQDEVIITGEAIREDRFDLWHGRIID